MSIEKINELESQVKQMQETIEQLKQENIAKEKELNQYKLPRVQKNNIYYYINNISSDNGFYNALDVYSITDDYNYYKHNYFTDKDKVKQYADHIKLTLELFQTRDIINDGWKPDWNDKSRAKYVITNAENKIALDTNYYSYTPLTFETTEKREKFIELIGKDKIMRFLSF